MHHLARLGPRQRAFRVHRDVRGVVVLEGQQEVVLGGFDLFDKARRGLGGLSDSFF